MNFDLAQLADLEKALRQTRIADLFPETGPLRRELYTKHMEFFEAGARHQERAFVAANRVGKSMSGCYEATLHMIGWYPPWWTGYRFTRPVVCWVCGEDAKAVRETLQPHLLGPPEDPGTGLIPGDKILRAPTRGGIADATDFAQIRHETGGISRLLFKAYEQKAPSFAGPHVDVIMLDEPPPVDVYTECLTRTMSTVPGEPAGIVMCTFTPIKGLTEVVQMYMPGGVLPATEELRKEAWGW